MKIIAAVDEKWGIGKGMNLLFRISEDMEFFKEKTMGKTVVMGRKTLESFPNAKPLKNRKNVVLTTDQKFQVRRYGDCSRHKNDCRKVRR